MNERQGSLVNLSHKLGTLGGVILRGDLVGYDDVYVRADESIREVLYIGDRTGREIVTLEAER